MSIRQSTAADLDELFSLYKAVAKLPGGLARLESEVTRDYVEGFLQGALKNGVSLVASEGERLIGEIHAKVPELFCFSHVLSDLTIAVHPDQQSTGVGRALFNLFMETVEQERPDITRVELIARESNQKAIDFYRSLGFDTEGRLVGRIKNLDGTLESDIPMAWLRS